METTSPLAYVTLAARFLVGCLFLYACIHKIGDPVAFAAAIRNYMIVPAAWSNIVAIALPRIKLDAGLVLILGFQTRPAALLTTSMLTVFLAALVYAYSIGLDIDCGCFSSAAESKGRVGLYHLVQDTALFPTSLFTLLMDNGEFSISRLWPLGRMRPSSTEEA